MGCAACRGEVSLGPAGSRTCWPGSPRQRKQHPTAVLQPSPCCHFSALSVRMRPLRPLGSCSADFAQQTARSLGRRLALSFLLFPFPSGGKENRGGNTSVLKQWQGSQRFGPPAQALLTGCGESRRCRRMGSRGVRAAGGIVPLAWEAQTMHVLTQPVTRQTSAKALVYPGRSAVLGEKG